MTRPEESWLRLCLLLGGVLSAGVLIGMIFMAAMC